MADSSNRAPVRRQRPVRLVLGLAGAGALVAGSLVIAPALKSPDQAAAEARAPAMMPVTAKLENRVLSENVVARGIVDAGASIDLLPSAATVSATPVITATPLARGAAIVPGTVIAEANGRPILAMHWPFPPYRDILKGHHGPDVRQLQETLAYLGYASSANAIFDPVTQSGLAQLYKDLGYTPALTPATDSKDAADVKSQVGDVYLPAAEVIVIPGQRHSVARMAVSVGTVLKDTASPIAQLDTQTSKARAALRPDDALKLAAGNAATLKDTRDNVEHQMKISSIATSSTEVPGIGAGVLVTFEFAGPAPAPTPEGLTMLIRIPSGGTPEPVLAAPITAIYSQADGTEFVTLAEADPREVTVTSGRNVGGWVEVTSAQEGAISAGQHVIVGMSRER